MPHPIWCKIPSIFSPVPGSFCDAMLCFIINISLFFDDMVFVYENKSPVNKIMSSLFSTAKIAEDHVLLYPRQHRPHIRKRCILSI
ncbi:MAG: hypothetical protein CO093_01100 [Alphaproteobacteria bacterium CG_4_9_14_3_um_filter_47_13]|nr:MAG: hypothetical protein CO093_01100 [Alphaproteobacteria bacterium CG_4_9_14_3_um_filter_47_13]